MLRNHIFLFIGGGGGSVHPLDPPMSWLAWKKKTFSLNSSLQLPKQTCHIKLFSLYKCPTVLSNGRLQPELLLKIPIGRIKLGCTVCTSNTADFTVVSCVDPGIFVRGGGGGVQAKLTEKNSDNVFLGISFLQFYRGGPMVYFKDDYKF